MMDQDQKQFNIRIELSDYQKLERIAREFDHSVSWCARKAIQDFIEANRSKTLAPIAKASAKS
ncbi:MAG: hypothetical protein WAN72_11755 [Candidatus Acidiferrales bacterium]